VTRDNGVFVIEYATLRLIAPRIAAAAPVSRPAMMRKQFERQGIYRALRLAGAKEGDSVRLLDFDFEFELEEVPPAPKSWLPRSDGIDGYTYIELKTGRIGALDPDEVTALAADVLPSVIEKLGTA